MKEPVEILKEFPLRMRVKIHFLVSRIDYTIFSKLTFWFASWCFKNRIGARNFTCLIVFVIKVVCRSVFAEFVRITKFRIKSRILSSLWVLGRVMFVFYDFISSSILWLCSQRSIKRDKMARKFRRSILLMQLRCKIFRVCRE